MIKFFIFTSLIAFYYFQTEVEKPDREICKVGKLIFENSEIVSEILTGKLNAESTIIAAHSSQLLSKNPCIIPIIDNKVVQIRGFDYIFMHKIEDWIRIYAIEYSDSKINLKLDVIVRDIIIKQGEVKFVKRNDIWSAEQIKMKEGSNKPFLRSGGFKDWDNDES